jgi:hypothetical protein
MGNLIEIMVIIRIVMKIRYIKIREVISNNKQHIKHYKTIVHNKRANNSITSKIIKGK